MDELDTEEMIEKNEEMIANHHKQKGLNLLKPSFTRYQIIYTS